MIVVSIVVPIYNAEYYLEKCIQSIINQTYSNLEIILVNDGSTDNSVDIIKKYRLKDNRIIFINKKNQGVSTARNVGIDAATGDYIAFVDSDDYIASNFAESLLEAIEKNNADLAICDYIRCFKNDVMINSGFKCNEDILYTDKDLNYFIYNNSKFVLTAIARLYSLDVIRKNGIRFHEDMSYGEDFIFQLEYTNKIEKISLIVNEKLYYRSEENPFSLSKNDIGLKFETHNKINERLLKIVEPYNALYEVAIINCIERFIQVVYGTIIREKGYECFISKLHDFFCREEIKLIVEKAISKDPTDKKVNFIKNFCYNVNKLKYLKYLIYFKSRARLRNLYIRVKMI